MENEFRDQFLENRQSYMMDNNSVQQLASAGDGVVGGVQAEVVVSGVAGEILGGKYDEHHEEHDDGDDDELKYAEEVQQSEKQQQQQLQTLKNIGLDDDGTYESNELAEKETCNNAVYDFGNGDGGFVFGGDHHQQQQHHDLFNVENGHDTNGHDIVNINDGFDTIVSTGFEEKLNTMESELDVFKNEADVSSTSNVTESGSAFVPQIDLNIETKIEHHEIVDEEEPSSLATNTTNGTSSLSENVPPQADPQTNVVDDLPANLEDKENSDPLTPQRPNALDLDQAHSQLNPDAKEFIPSFGSNPASPTSPFATGMPQNEPVLSEIMETQMYFGQAPNLVANHLLGDDDFVAQSPAKGKGDNNMDAVSIPRELLEFEQEADKRPHELEPEGIEGFNQRDEVMTPDQAVQQLPLDDIVTIDQENQLADTTDFQPTNFTDHGPETCVDLDADLDIQSAAVFSSLQGEDDVMKRSMYVASDDAIEDVLNSVQPIPTEVDSFNNSFIEELATESVVNQLAGDKELLQVEEKEHVSHSPSTEEIQMNLQNTLNSSNKDIPQLPVDMDNANNVQKSLFVEQLQYIQQDHDPEQNQQCQTKNPFDLEEILLDQQSDANKEQLPFQEELLKDNQTGTDPEILDEQLSSPKEIKEKFEPEKQTEEQQHVDKPIELTGEEQLYETQITMEAAENSLLGETTNPLLDKVNFMDDTSGSYENQQHFNEPFSPFKITDDLSNTHALECVKTEMISNLQHQDVSDIVMTPSFTVDEKHLLEETKEKQLFALSGLEQQMSEMILNNTDGNLSQAEEVAATTATAAIEDISENLITPDEAIEQKEHLQNTQEEDKSEMVTLLVDDSFNRHEQECQQEYMLELQKDQEMDVEIKTKPDIVHELIESPTEQQYQQQLESEVAAIEEPMIDVKQSKPLFTNEETEFNTEERKESPLCRLPESALNDFPTMEPTMIHQTETEIENRLEEQFQRATEEVQAEIIKEPEEELKIKEVQAVKEEVVATSEIGVDVPVEAAIVAATAAVAATAVLATKEATSPSHGKEETAKKPLTKTTTAPSKTKVASTTAPKKPVVLAAKTRTAPAKPTGVAAAATTNRKPTTAPKVATKTTTTTSTSRTLTTASKTTAAKPTTITSKPTTTPRTVPSSTLTARKPTTTNGSLAKPRPATAPAKPTTLGLSAANGAPKTKPLSPRATSTSQVRKTAPAPTAAKSPVKTTTTNSVAKTAAATLASRTKITTSTATSAAGTASKTFTARPAPKFTSSSSTTITTTTTKRSALATSTTSSTTTTALKTNSTSLRKSTPTKQVTNRTPTKATAAAGGLKSKTSATKTASPATKPAPIRKPVDNTAAAITNGEAKQLNGTSEEQQNGNIQALQLEQQQNGDASIPMQSENIEQPFIKSRDEQISIDLINA